MNQNSLPEGERIRSLRLRRGMTQEKLAAMSGVDIKTIYRAERGIGEMRAETLLDIATALDVPLEEIRDAGQARRRGDADTASGPEREGHGNLVLRRIERASSFYQLAERCEIYSWSFHVDPDADTAARISEFMRIIRRALEGPGDASDAFDAAGEFSEPAHVARLKQLLAELREADVSVLANKFIRFEAGDSTQRSGVVLRVVFVEGDIRRRKEFADYSLPRALPRALPDAAVDAQDNDSDPKEVPGMEQQHQSNVIEGIARLDFARHGNSVMGALALALQAIGEPYDYDYLMGASGAAFRLQMALPEWCPSAPFACVGNDCVPAVALAIGRTIEWVQVETGAARPMQCRIDAIIESIDRRVPVLYAAEECGLIVGYHRRGQNLSLRTYFDSTEMYAVLDQLGWPSPGILGESKQVPSRLETLGRSVSRALELAHCTERYGTHHAGREYACGFLAWEAWIDGLADDTRFEGRAVSELQVPIQANSWCFKSLVDACGAAARYLRSFASEVAAGAGGELERAADLYQQIADGLGKAVRHIPRPQMHAQEDQIGVGYRLEGSDPWSVDARRTQAEALRAALELERQAVAGLERSGLAH